MFQYTKVRAIIALSSHFHFSDSVPVFARFVLDAIQFSATLTHDQLQSGCNALRPSIQEKRHMQVPIPTPRKSNHSTFVRHGMSLCGIIQMEVINTT